MGSVVRAGRLQAPHPGPLPGGAREALAGAVGLNFGVSGSGEAEPPSSDIRFAPATFSHRGRRGAEDVVTSELPHEPPSPLVGEGPGMRGALSLQGNSKETIHGIG